MDGNAAPCRVLVLGVEPDADFEDAPVVGGFDVAGVRRDWQGYVTAERPVAKLTAVLALHFLECLGVMKRHTVAVGPSDRLVPLTDQLWVAVTAWPARFKGSFRYHRVRVALVSVPARLPPWAAREPGGNAGVGIVRLGGKRQAVEAREWVTGS